MTVSLLNPVKQEKTSIERKEKAMDCAFIKLIRQKPRIFIGIYRLKHPCRPELNHLFDQHEITI